MEHLLVFELLEFLLLGEADALALLLSHLLLHKLLFFHY